MNMKSQDTTANITKSGLDNGQKTLKQVNDIMVRFEQEMLQSNSTAGLKQEKVNPALVSFRQL